MEKLLLTIEKQNFQMICRMMILLTLFELFGITTHARPLLSSGGIISTTSAARCGEGSVTLRASAGSGTIKWYSVPFYGTPIATGAVFTTPSLVVSTTYFVDEVDANGCSVNPGSQRVPVTATINSNLSQSSIYYASSTYCKTVADWQAINLTGNPGGTFSVSPSVGLDFNSSNGSIRPSTSSEGTYTITYNAPAIEGCIESPASTTLTVTTSAVAPSISYSGSPFCNTHGTVSVIQDGASGGTYSASPSGLTINANSGTITPSSSLPGTYTITYFVAGSGGCVPQTATTSASITALPSAVISYNGSPFCKDIAIPQVPTITGAGAYTGGIFSASGINVDASTGVITPGDNAPGSYTIYYSIPASGNCTAVNTSTSITINSLPTASISGAAIVCQNAPSPQITFTGLTGTPPFTFTYKVNNGENKYITTTTGNSVDVSQATLSAESYVYTLAAITDANGCSQSASGTATINVTGVPVADFSYPNAIYCTSGTAAPTYNNGGIAGTFSSTSGLVFVSGQPGVIDITNSLSGTYTITNTISGCGTVTATTEVTISHINPTISGGEVASCESTPLLANSESSNVTYVWLKNDGIIDNQTSSSLVVTESGSYSVKITNVDTGCEETSAAKTVTINSAPACSITASSSDAVKYGSTTTYSAPDGMSSYAWTITGNGTINGATHEKTVSVDATAAGTFLLSLTIKNSDNCTSTCETVVYVEKADPTITWSNPSNIVYGKALDATQLNATVSGVSGGSATGALTYDPVSGTVLNAGSNQYLMVTASETENYNEANKTVQINVTPAIPTVSITGGTFTYNATSHAATGFAYGVGGVESVLSPAVTFSYVGISGTTYGSSLTAPKNAGTYQANASFAGNSNYTPASNTATITINPLQLTITGSAVTTTKVYDGSTAAAVTAGALQNAISNDDLTVSATASYDNANVGSGKTITVTYTIDGTNAGNYTAPENYTTTGQINPPAPTAATHFPSENQIVWNWNAVTGATGYKWSVTNDYNSATDLGNTSTTTQTGLNCNTAYTIYVWGYNGTCVSSAAMFTATTPSCSFSITSINFANGGSITGTLETNDKVIITFSKEVIPFSIYPTLTKGGALPLTNGSNQIDFFLESNWQLGGFYTTNGWNIGTFTEHGEVNVSGSGTPHFDMISLDATGTILTLNLANASGHTFNNVSGTTYVGFTPDADIKAIDGASITQTEIREPDGSNYF